MKVYEFILHDDFKNAAYRLSEEGNLLEVYSFLPEDEISEKLKVNSSIVSYAAIGGAIAGAVGGFLLQYISNLYLYPINVGGRPLNSWPAFLLITFEMGVLGSAFSIVGSFIFSNKLPRFDREIYSLEAYNTHRHDRYFLVAKEEDHHVKAHAIHDLNSH